ncbi:MAG: CPBP family intramembrane metalloprotease [Deltaproteobacteria bacterium]|nr:CPBP family intramembrane metalloprotease [Deltaproteobacteria bacterium]
MYRESDSPDRTPLIGSGLLRALLCLIFYLMLWQVVQRIFLASVASLSVDMDGVIGLGMQQWFSVLSAFFTIHIPIVITVVVCRLAVDRRPVSTLGLCVDSIPQTFILGILLAGGVVCAVFFVLLLLGVVALKPSGLYLGWSGFAVLTAYHFVIAFAEELLMRGYLVANLRASVNRYLAVFISGVVFAGAHCLNLHLSAVGAFNLFLMGAAFALYYMEKRNLWLPIGAHWSWNVIQGPVLGYSVSGKGCPSIIAHSSTGSDLLTGGSFGMEGSLLVTGVLTLGPAAAFLLSRRGKERERAVF